jgi:hypothetical protein
MSIAVWMVSPVHITDTNFCTTHKTSGLQAMRYELNLEKKISGSLCPIMSRFCLHSSVLAKAVRMLLPPSLSRLDKSSPLLHELCPMLFRLLQAHRQGIFIGIRILPDHIH